MATIDKKLIHFNRKADFEARLAAGEIRDYSIVCIKDAKLIWTHGQYYGDLSECLTKYPQEFTKEEKDQMLENLGYYAVEWDGVSETIELSDEEYRKVLSATNVYLVFMDVIYIFPTIKSDGIYGYNFIQEYSISNFLLYTSTNPMTITVSPTLIPKTTSDLENDSSFVSAVDTGEEVDGVETDYVTEAAMSAALSFKQDTITDLSTIRSGASKGATAVQPSELANVAKSGSYNDLKDKPTIPSAVTESTVSGWGFTKNTGTYSKPSTGIPKSDLASAVQASLDKADTALQSYTEQYKGTVTGVKVNGATKSPSSGTVDIGNVVTSVKINGSAKSPSSGVVDLGTVITSHQDISGKQDKLVSGTNIKTINGASILGSGDIVIEAGSSGGGGAYTEVSHGTGDTTFALTPNTFHVWDEVASLDLSFAEETAGVANEYLFQFTSGATATTLTLPDVKWASDTPPTIAENMIYQISVLKGLASVLEFKVNLQLIENLITVTLNGMNINASSQYPVMSDIIITTSSGTVTIANGDSNGTSVIDMPAQTFEVLQIMPSSDNTYAYTY